MKSASGNKKLIYFGDTRYGQYIDKLGHYSSKDHRQAKQTMRSFYGGASIQGAAMPGKMPADVVTSGKSSPRGYLDYAARADTSLAKGVVWKQAAAR